MKWSAYVVGCWLLVVVKNNQQPTTNRFAEKGATSLFSVVNRTAKPNQTTSAGMKWSGHFVMNWFGGPIHNEVAFAGLCRYSGTGKKKVYRLDWTNS